MRLIDMAAETQTTEQAFLNDLKRSIELSDEKNRRLPSKTYKPSGMNCIRASYYQIIGATPEKISNASSELIGICESGSDRHERIQKAIADMKNNGMDCEYINVADYVKEHKLKNVQVVSQQGMETKLFHKTMNMSFLCDGIIRYHDKHYIFEFKTESSFKWNKRDEVDPGHYNQATCYSIALEIDDVLFVYENRDTLGKKAYMFTPTNEMKESIIAYIEECDDCVKHLKPPAVDFSTKNCGYCGYKAQCRKDG